MYHYNNPCPYCNNHQRPNSEVMRCPCSYQPDMHYYYPQGTPSSYRPNASFNMKNKYRLTSDYSSPYEEASSIPLMDYGPNPIAINIEDATLQNNAFRTALWTGDHLQLTLMSINVGEDIGFEVHEDLDQFIRIEEGQGIVLMGDSPNQMDFQEYVSEDFIFIIPAGKWHNLINMGNQPLKLYSIYAPPQHPQGTVHETKEDAMAEEE